MGQTPFEQITSRIDAACKRANRDPSDVKLIAVTKGHTPAEIEAAVLSHGHRALGENRIQEWRDKAAQLPDTEWHFIGNLQRNKVRYCQPFELIHSLNSERLADELSSYATKHNHTFRVLLEVNVAAEESKQGIALAQAPELAAYVKSLPGVELVGLMTMAPYSENPEDSRPSFQKLRELRDRLTLRHLSMGMSGDFEVAIEEGATLVRIGSALF
jgi:pyridoxal phosphate enzyme (YggS family)